MTHQSWEARKLAELRALTDRQLTEMIANRLERGFELAARPDCGSSEHRREVTRLVSEIVLLLPAVSRADRVRLQSQLAHLEDALTISERMQVAS